MFRSQNIFTACYVWHDVEERIQKNFKPLKPKRLPVFLRIFNRCKNIVRIKYILHTDFPILMVFYPIFDESIKIGYEGGCFLRKITKGV
jgi:hypothetical protein